MTKQQENRAFAKMLKEFPKAFGRVSFRERLMLRTAFNYVVEEVIADIKANCDLAIEGRDIKIKELELELAVEKDLHQEESELHLHAEEYIKSLEQQIEKMKRHCNCKHRDSEGYCEVKRTYLIDLSYDGCDKWELED